MALESLDFHYWNIVFTILLRLTAVHAQWPTIIAHVMRGKNMGEVKF